MMATAEELLRSMCRDYADTHTHLQRLCLAAGCPAHTVEGDSYGVPGIEDLADMLARMAGVPEETIDGMGRP
jgi:hypothetical protein